MYGADLKIGDHEIDAKDTLEKNGARYLHTSSRSTTKKASKMEAAEKMVNLIRGDGAFTNEHVRMNRELAEYNKTTLNLQEDRIDTSRLSATCSRYLAQMSAFAAQFLQDKPNYDPDFDFLAEVCVSFCFRPKSVSIRSMLCSSVYA